MFARGKGAEAVACAQAPAVAIKLYKNNQKPLGNMSNQGARRNGPVKLRLTVLCAKNLVKKDFFRLPDPFAKIVVDGSGQCHSTDTVKNTLDPKWNQHYDLYWEVRFYNYQCLES